MLRNEDSTCKTYNLIQLRQFASRAYYDSFACGAGLSAVVASLCDLSDGNFDHPYLLTTAALSMCVAIYNRGKNGRDLGLSKLEKDLQLDPQLDLQLEDTDSEKP